jgi:hypothetical protein
MLSCQTLPTNVAEGATKVSGAMTGTSSPSR